MLKAEQILKLVEAGYTKEEISKMDNAEPSQETEQKPSEEVKDALDQESSVKKNSDSDSASEKEKGEYQILNDKIRDLEQKIYIKNREDAVISSEPSEDLSLPHIFSQLD